MNDVSAALHSSPDCFVFMRVTHVSYRMTRLAEFIDVATTNYQ